MPYTKFGEAVRKFNEFTEAGIEDSTEDIGDGVVDVIRRAFDDVMAIEAQTVEQVNTKLDVVSRFYEGGEVPASLIARLSAELRSLVESQTAILAPASRPGFEQASAKLRTIAGTALPMEGTSGGH